MQAQLCLRLPTQAVCPKSLPRLHSWTWWVQNMAENRCLHSTSHQQVLTSMAASSGLCNASGRGEQRHPPLHLPAPWAEAGGWQGNGRSLVRGNV